MMLFATGNNVPLQMLAVDLLTGEQNKVPCEAINPNQLAPTLDDGDFCLTESSAILEGQPMVAP
jgi:glutathione S-transferase